MRRALIMGALLLAACGGSGGTVGSESSPTTTARDTGTTVAAVVEAEQTVGTGTRGAEIDTLEEANGALAAAGLCTMTLTPIDVGVDEAIPTTDHGCDLDDGRSIEWTLYENDDARRDAINSAPDKYGPTFRTYGVHAVDVVTAGRWVASVTADQIEPEPSEATQELTLVLADALGGEVQRIEF